MPTTSNFGWTTPADTDLVKDGALAIRTLGNGIDTSMAQLKGGTTGQVLSKTSNTDMAFTWVTQDDANAIQNAIVDAKGDLIAATANDTPARLAVGNNGETLVADSSQTTGLRWAANYGFTAGKNKIINGDFGINQRAFSSTTSSGVYTFDRFITECGGGTATYSAQTFTAGSAPVTGYESTNFLQIVTSGQTGTSGYALIDQRIENVRTFANQTMTLSFWAKASSGTPKIGTSFIQNFGSGGSASVIVAGGDVTISTSWARYSVTVTIPSVSGKTIGSSSYLRTLLFVSAGTDFGGTYTNIGLQNNTFQIWGIQAEIGSVATAFQTATGTLAGELLAAQRYYVRWGGQTIYESMANANCPSTTAVSAYVIMPVEMRVPPTSIDANALAFYDGQTVTAVSSPSFNTNIKGTKTCQINWSATGLTQYRYGVIIANNSSSAFLGLSAEL